MKAKKLEKILTKVIKKSKKRQSTKYKDLSPVALVDNDILFTESSDEVKKKSRNMILRLLGHRDEIQFNIDQTSMNLHSENKIGNSAGSNKNFYFHLEIIKGVGFILNCNEKRILLKDENLFDDINPKIEGIFSEINLENFNNMYSSIMKENKLSRESNLDELLGVFV